MRFIMFGRYSSTIRTLLARTTRCLACGSTRSVVRCEFLCREIRLAHGSCVRDLTGLSASQPVCVHQEGPGQGHQGQEVQGLPQHSHAHHWARQHGVSLLHVFVCSTSMRRSRVNSSSKGCPAPTTKIRPRTKMCGAGLPLHSTPFHCQHR